MGYQKKRDGMPKKYDPKKREKNGHINVHEKKNIYIYRMSFFYTRV